MFNYYQQSTKALSYKGQNYSSYGTKKIGNFSYSSSDKIGKGFSSVVYKGTNDNTSTIYSQHDLVMSHYFLKTDYFRINSCHKSH